MAGKRRLSHVIFTSQQYKLKCVPAKQGLFWNRMLDKPGFRCHNLGLQLDVWAVEGWGRGVEPFFPQDTYSLGKFSLTQIFHSNQIQDSSLMASVQFLEPKCRACSRLSVVGDELKERMNKRKNEGGLIQGTARGSLSSLPGLSPLSLFFSLVPHPFFFSLMP